MSHFICPRVRGIAYELHPSTLDHLGLSVALRSFSREFSEREGIPVRFTGRTVPARIPAGVATSLYRIAQEALRNVAKHAGRTIVKISLKLAGQGARVMVNYQRNAEAAGQVVEAVRAAGGEAVAYQADVSKYEEAQGLVQVALGAITAHYGVEGSSF